MNNVEPGYFFSMMSHNVFNWYHKRVPTVKKFIHGKIHMVMKDSGDAKICLYCRKLPERNQGECVEKCGANHFKVTMSGAGLSMKQIQQEYTCNEWELNTAYTLFADMLSQGKRAEKRGFYNSMEWKVLRAKALEQQGAKCQECGRTPQGHGIVLHVDHIVPLSKDWNRRLDITNLQILCEDCNIGKGNRYQTDWRSVPKGGRTVWK
jgi:hypothetical protein